MQVLKFLLIIMAIFASESMSEEPRLYIEDVSFMVGIFKINDKAENEVSFVSAGVLVNPRAVLTSSLNISEDSQYVVRAYNWSKTASHFTDKTTSPGDYFQIKASTIQEFDRIPLIKIINLESDFGAGVATIDYLNFMQKNMFNETGKCAYVKLRNKQTPLGHQLTVEQVKIVPKPPERVNCSSELRSVADGLTDLRYNKDSYFCGIETGNKNCRSYPGSALVCKSAAESDNFLMGIQQVNDDCELLFDSPKYFGFNPHIKNW